MGKWKHRTTDKNNGTGFCEWDRQRVPLTPRGSCAIANREQQARCDAEPARKAAHRERDARYHALPAGKATLRRFGQRRHGHLVPELNLREKEILVGMQGNQCPICLTGLDARAVWGDPRFPERDHDHLTHLYRGYLCHGCNSCLDRFDRETPKGARAAAYIELADTHIMHEFMVQVQSVLIEQELLEHCY